MGSVVIMMVVPDWKVAQQKKKDLKAAEEQLAEVQAKNKKIDELIASYNQNSEKVNIINDYVPFSAGDEEIINNLIFYANAQGGENALSFSDISIGKSSASQDKASFSPLAQPANWDGEMPGDIGISGKRLAVGEVPAEPVFFDVKISFKVKYKGIKEFFSKISALKRSNNVSAFNIIKSDKADELNLDATLSFNYLEKYNPEIINASFLKEGLDLSVAERIKSKATANIEKVTVESAGRENPFLP